MRPGLRGPHFALFVFLPNTGWQCGFFRPPGIGPRFVVAVFVLTLKERRPRHTAAATGQQQQSRLHKADLPHGLSHPASEFASCISQERSLRATLRPLPFAITTASVRTNTRNPDLFFDPSRRRSPAKAIHTPRKPQQIRNNAKIVPQPPQFDTIQPNTTRAIFQSWQIRCILTAVSRTLATTARVPLSGSARIACSSQLGHHFR